MKYKKISLYAVTVSLLLTSSCRLVPSRYDNKEINSLYYTKGIDRKVDIDEVILTMYEKNNISMSNIGKEYINKIENINYEYDSKWIDKLNINMDILTDKYVVNNINKHSNNKYYDSKNNTIKWDKLIDIIYENSIRRENNTDYIALSKSDIKIVLSQMNEFLNIVITDYPSFDVSNLACKLSNLSLVYFYREKDDKAKATCVQDMISIGINEDDTNPNLNNYKDLLYHEFKHLFCFSCRDEMKGSYYTAGGISSNKGYDINLKFIEEALAEEYAAKCNSRDMSCYYNQYTVLNTLRLVLSLQDDYDENNFLKYQLLHNPVALLQQFPVYDNNEIYYRNITMLECFNELLMNNDSYENNINESSIVPNILVKQDAYQSLFNYSMCELNRMFFTNLVALNESNDVSLDYNLFLINLYLENNKNTIDVLSTTELNQEVYLNNFYDNYKLFIDYYSINKNMDSLFIDIYKLRLPNEYPSYVSDDKIKLYNFIYSDGINSKCNVLTLN